MELSLSIHGRDQEYFERVMGNSWWRSSGDGYDLMASLLGASALRSLEEIRIKLKVVQSPAHCRRDKELTSWVYKLDPADLPGHTLRMLDLEHCRLESPSDSAAVSFPRLSSLRLHKCSSSTKDLEGWIRTAPTLGNLHIQDHNFYCTSDNTRSDHFEVHSRSLMALTLVPSSGYSREPIFEVDAPRLRTFKYKGELQKISMKSSQTTKVLARVDLAVQRIYDGDGKAVKTWYVRFWQFLRNFRHVKAIKLKVPNIEGIALHKDAQHEHLFTLPALETLELRGFSDPDRRDDAALAIANLLQCCPVLQNLRIRIPTDPFHHAHYVDTRREVRVSDFDLCMDVFRRRFSKEMDPDLMLDDQDDGSVLPGLTGCRFCCLDNHLKNVTLQFEMEEMNSFEVCLAKFFAENCMVIEAFQIDDGKQNFLRHVNWMAQRWRANALKRSKQLECDSTDSSKQMRKRKRNYRVYNVE
jgi:hypothetical protein